jgi:hypothetical protein
MKGEEVMFWMLTLIHGMNDDSSPGPGGPGGEEGNGNGGGGGG